jgi:glycosyltransferase involved in cell wall biosynthesis
VLLRAAQQPEHRCSISIHPSKDRTRNPKGAESSTTLHVVIGITCAQSCVVLPARVDAFRAAGFLVSVVSGPGKQLDDTAQAEGVNAHPISIQRGMAPLADCRTLIILCRLLHRLRPDLVEFSTPKAGFLGSLAAKLCGVPTRIYSLRGLKLESAHGWKRSILLAAERVAASCAHVVLCNSDSLRAQALALGIAPASKLMVLGDGSSNGVDADRFSPGATTVRARLGIAADAKVLGFVGRLTCDKGLPELIDAFEMILKSEPEACLLLVGWFDKAEDAVDEGLRQRILNHPRIVFTGFVADTAPYYRAMDILILPTRREGFPNVVLEAAATGIPVIATLCTGSCDAVVPEVTGLLIPPGYPEAICEAALNLLRDPARRHRMGIAARAWVIERFLDAQVLGLTIALYENLMKQSGGESAAEIATDLSVSP